jgi:hypothetical protein
MRCCFSTATVVTRTRHNVTLYIHCLFCCVCTRLLGMFSCSPYWSTWLCCWCSDFREIRKQSVVVDCKLCQFYL